MPATEPSTRPTTEPAVKAEDAEKTLNELLRAKPGMAKPLQPAALEEKRIDESSGAGSLAPNAPEVPLKKEGQLLSQRVVRLAKSDNGVDWELYFDSDGKSLEDPPLIALENKNLMRMQEQQKTAGREMRFLVSGVLTEYRGRNYLLVEKAEVVPDESKSQ